MDPIVCGLKKGIYSPVVLKVAGEGRFKAATSAHENRIVDI